MKKLSEITKFRLMNESCVTADKNRGNDIKLGVTNHLIPINNIVSNVRNLFQPKLGIVACVAEDEVSIKLHSSKFVDKHSVEVLLNDHVYNNLNLKDYIIQQGLDTIKLVNLGQYYVVYFSPSDIAACPAGNEPGIPCEELKECNLIECEIDTLNSMIFEDDEEELEDEDRKKLIEIVKMPDKYKAAKQFAALISKEIELPADYYFAAVKDSDNHESIALRYKFQKRRPFGKTTDITKSIMNIYNMGEQGIWIDDMDKYDKKESKDLVVNKVDPTYTLIKSILDFIGAKPTDDECVWSLPEKTDDEDEKKEKKKTEDEKDKETDMANAQNQSLDDVGDGATINLDGDKEVK